MAKELQRKLGFWSCLAVSVGLVVASSTLVSLGQGMGIAGAGFILAMAAAWLLQHFSAQSYSELACMMPSAGSIRSYTRVAMGALPALVATISGFIIPNLLAGPTELAVAGSVISENFVVGSNPTLWSVIILIVLMVTNLIGVDIFAKFQMFFTISMMVSISLLGIIGLSNLGFQAPELPETGFNPMGWKVFGLTALAIWLYIGIEFVTPLAEETINPNKNIPRAMTIGLILIFIVNILYGFASIKYVPGEELAGSNIPHILVAKAILGKKGVAWIAFISILASASTINTVISVVPRMLYGMAINKEMPLFLSKIHKRFKTPYLGIIFMAASVSVFLIGGIAESENLIVFILAACCSWLICYIIAHIDVIILRIRYPQAERPYKSPLFPIPQIIGIIGMLYSIIHIAPVPEMAGQIYTIAGILVGVAVLYSVIWLRMVNKTPLFQPLDLDEAMQEWQYDDSDEEYDLIKPTPALLFSYVQNKIVKI